MDAANDVHGLGQGAISRSCAHRGQSLS